MRRGYGIQEMDKRIGRREKARREWDMYRRGLARRERSS